MNDKKQKYNERNRKQIVQIPQAKRNVQWHSQTNSYFHVKHELSVPSYIKHVFILLAEALIWDMLFCTTVSNVCLATSSEHRALPGAPSYGHMSYGRGIFFCVILKSLEHFP
jgi:hypothetical protein